MTHHDLLQLARDLRCIPGVYNYCDRWCERCLLTPRCLLKASLDREDAASPTCSTEGVLQKMHSSFETMIALLAEVARTQGIDSDAVSNAETEVDAQTQAARWDAARHHELSRLSMRYAELVGDWFDTERDQVRRWAAGIAARADSGEPPDHDDAQAGAVADAIQVIAHYQYRIHVKLVRALGYDRHEGAAAGDDPVQNDGNGSAKVALLGIERSAEAWRALQAAWPEAGTIGAMVVLVDRLRARVLAEFPEAPRFLRPGFDTLAPPAMRVLNPLEFDTRP